LEPVEAGSAAGAATGGAFAVAAAGDASGGWDAQEDKSARKETESVN
jgi:hypothetical protein